MKKPIDIVAAIGVALLLCIPACGADKAAQGDGAQQKISLKTKANVVGPVHTSGAKDQFVDAKPSSKVDVTKHQKETPEQRLRRLKNESERDRCLELLKQATQSQDIEYRENTCVLKLKKNANQYVQANLNYADATASSSAVTFTCRPKGRIGDCVSNGSTPIGSEPPRTAGATVYGDANASELQQCLDFLHERCKQM